LKNVKKGYKLLQSQGFLSDQNLYNEQLSSLVSNDQGGFEIKEYSTNLPSNSYQLNMRRRGRPKKVDLFLSDLLE